MKRKQSNNQEKDELKIWCRNDNVISHLKKMEQIEHLGATLTIKGKEEKEESEIEKLISRGSEAARKIIKAKNISRAAE